MKENTQVKKNSATHRGTLWATNGFTIIEVMMAIIVLVTGILALLAILSACMYQQITSREADIAKSTAAAKLEEIRAKGETDFVNVCTAYSGTNFAVSELQTQTGDPNPGYIMIDNSNPELLDITVRVRWLSRSGPSANLSTQMKTMLTRSK